MSDRVLAIVVIYDHPRDFPNDYVARRQWATSAGGVEVEPEPFAADPSLEVVRASVPPGMTCLDRDPTDDATILEVWI